MGGFSPGGCDVKDRREAARIMVRSGAALMWKERRRAEWGKDKMYIRSAG
jgi:hypothetical protein